MTLKTSQMHTVKPRHRKKAYLQKHIKQYYFAEYYPARLIKIASHKPTEQSTLPVSSEGSRYKSAQTFWPHLVK